jgi:glycolate dehydrogenase FAD-binding subunit
MLRPSPHPIPEGEGKIDSVPVRKVIRPESIQELADSIANEKGTIIPIGARTHLDFGNPLRSADCGVDLTHLRRITEYNPADLTVHVQAGVTLGQLQNALLDNNQFLPLDPWNGQNATIGGIAAANAQGPYRAVGTIRDWIIGMSVVDITGRTSKTGGRVVKNVTGYDLHKLYTGSLGTLVVIAEVSLKLRAKFGGTATAVTQTSSTEAAAKLIASIRNSQVQPVSCEWIGPENDVWVRVAEHPKAVEWQLQNLPPADWTILEEKDEAALWEKLRMRYQELLPVIVRVIGLPTTTHEIIKEYRPTKWMVHALNGIVLAQVSSAVEVSRIREKHRAIIEKASLETRREIGTFGLTDAEYLFMKKMKDTFDPEARLNPGRHVDGERRQ